MGSIFIQTWKQCLNSRLGRYHFMEGNLQDIPFSGPRFTWTNNREDEALIIKRLDRGYASLEWLHDFSHTHIRNLPFVHSNHGPILLQITIPEHSTRRPYQIENWCFHYDEVQLMVQEIWILQIVGSYTYFLSRRLKLLRKKLRT